MRRAPLFSFLIAAASTIGSSACERSPITPARIERAIAATFANLVQVQVSRLKLPAMAASDFRVSASCRKPAACSIGGSGEWACTLLWQGPDRQPLRDVYDLFVTTDGCYSATVSGESLGGPTLTASDGNEVRNLLYAFEGCFDTT